MTAVGAATHNNPLLKAFYDRLVAQRGRKRSGTHRRSCANFICHPQRHDPQRYLLAATRCINTPVGCLSGYLPAGFMTTPTAPSARVIKSMLASSRDLRTLMSVLLRIGALRLQLQYRRLRTIAPYRRGPVVTTQSNARAARICEPVIIPPTNPENTVTLSIDEL